MHKIRKSFIIILFAAICCISCKLASINYSFKGGTLSPDVKTFSVDYFPNKSLLVVPSLSEQFTEELKKYIIAQTHLDEITDGQGNVAFEGEITTFKQAPINITSSEVATSNRLTIEIRVKFTNEINEEFSFDSKFSAYEDYSIDDDYDSIEQSLIDKILDKILDDIYNKAFVNW